MEYDIANLNVPAEIVQILKKSFSCKKHYGKDVEVCPVRKTDCGKNAENICDNEVCNWYIQKEKIRT